EELPDAPIKGMRSNLPLLDRQQAFGYSQEDVTILMTPMAATGEEAAGSIGNDTPISALSDRPKPLFTYFKQNFAQVTNPPIDPIRDELVISMVSIARPQPKRTVHRLVFYPRAPPDPVRPAGLCFHQAAGSAPADPDRRGSGEDP